MSTSYPRVFALFLVVLPACPGSAEDMHAELRVRKSGNDLAIERCIRYTCTSVEMPQPLKDQIAEGDSISIEDINADGISEVVSTTTHDVNNCSSFYNYESKSGSLVSFDPAPYQICNHHSAGGYLFSSYREAGSWREDIYKKRNGLLVLSASDNCIGCGEVRRTVYRDGIPSGSMIVSDELSYFDRKPVVTRVTTRRAPLFNSADPANVTTMYLVKGDVVNLLDYSENGDGWYKIRYEQRGGSMLTKWMRCNDLAACDTQ